MKVEEPKHAAPNPEQKRENIDVLLADLADLGPVESPKQERKERQRPTTQQSMQPAPQLEGPTRQRPRTQQHAPPPASQQQQQLPLSPHVRPRSRAAAPKAPPPPAQPEEAPLSPKTPTRAQQAPPKTPSRTHSRSALAAPPLPGEARNLGSSHASRRVIGGVVRNPSAPHLDEEASPLSPVSPKTMGSSRPSASSHGRVRKSKGAASAPTICMMDAADEELGNDAARESSLARGYEALGCSNFHSMDQPDTPTNGASTGAAFGLASTHGARQALRSSSGASHGMSASLGGSLRAASALMGRREQQAPSALAMDLGEGSLQGSKLFGKRVEQPSPARSTSLGSVVMKSKNKELISSVAPPATPQFSRKARPAGQGATHSAGSVAWSVHMARAQASGTAGLRRHHSEGRLAPAF